VTSAPSPPHHVPSGAASLQLLALAQELKDRETVTIGEVLDGLGRANLGLTLLLVALPAMIPIPGPVAMFLGGCLAIIAVQVMCGVRRIWLPSWLRKRSVSPSIVGAMAERGAPWLRRAEALLRPRRMKHFTGRIAQAVLGLPILLLSIALALPLPLGNMLPVIALSLIALAILQRDGLAVIAALAITVLALVWTGILLIAGSSIVNSLLSWIG
jgi:hypothetical protein